jgi:hypothetical protein
MPAPVAAAAAPAAGAAGGGLLAKLGGFLGSKGGATAMMAGGSILGSFLDNEAEERMFREKMALQNKMFKHQKNMEESQNKRTQESHTSSENRADAAFDIQLRDDAQQQALYLNALKTMNAAGA